MPRIEFELLTLFPEIFDGFLRSSLLGKALDAGIVAVHRTNPRDFAQGKHRPVDDTPYGGGPGMVMRVEPVAAAIEACVSARGPAHRILLTPGGRLFDQSRARDLADRGRVLLVCGRYEGLDERIAALCSEELAIGDYVLAGGEMAAAVVIEAVTRLVPGVLGSPASAIDESFAAGRLEYPQRTRPPEWRGARVPDVLLSGDHEAVRRWRLGESLRRTQERRPDLLEKHPLTDEEKRLMGPPPRRRPQKPPGGG